MENLRWILILAGIAILVVLFISGRRGNSSGGSLSGTDRSNDRRGRGTGNDPYDPLTNDGTLNDPIADFNDVDPDDFARPGLSNGPVDGYTDSHGPGEYEFEDDLGRSLDSSPGFTSFAQKIESISDRLTPKRRQRVAEATPTMENDVPAVSEHASKIVTLHVVAPGNTLINGEQLLDIFDRRGYHYGDMNIFHSMHKGDTVFSLAKMIKPGYFDIDDLETFVTPGISLILQLPGPVPADVSFEVLVSEAFEIANELNANVLDGDRNTLSKQTLQHMREGIYEYMHRQKYFSSVSS